MITRVSVAGLGCGRDVVRATVVAVIRKRVRVAGRVQGVYYRDTCRRVAVAHGVTGWARNRADGTVEAVFEGTPEAVSAMLTWAAQGPSQAHVTGVEVSDEAPEGLSGFAIG